MHPDDVADYVVEQVDWVRERLADHPELRVSAVELEDDVKLYITFTKIERPRVSAITPPRLLGPGKAPIAFQYTGIDLSRTTERELMLHCDCGDFDGQPPTAALMRPDRTPLPADQWPKDLTGQGIVHDHPDYRRPFFCRPGLREFHTHPQHEDQPWDRYRESMSLSRIIIPLLDDLQHRWMLPG